MRLVTSLVAAAFIATASWAGEMESPKGRVLVTLGGDVTHTNAPGFKEGAVNVAGFLEVEAEKAMAFDDAMLASLDQHEITTKILDNASEVTYSGPRLSAVMTAAGADGKIALPMALDGFSAEIPWDKITELEPILATHADGAPLTIGKLGPAMIVFPGGQDEETRAALSAMEVFATFYIGIE